MRFTHHLHLECHMHPGVPHVPYVSFTSQSFYTSWSNTYVLHAIHISTSISTLECYTKPMCHMHLECCYWYPESSYASGVSYAFWSAKRTHTLLVIILGKASHLDTLTFQPYASTFGAENVVL